MKTEANQRSAMIKFPIKTPFPKTAKMSLTEMDFPTLEDLEMDVPLLNEHMGQLRIAPEDETECEVQCLKLWMPSLEHSSLDL